METVKINMPLWLEGDWEELNDELLVRYTYNLKLEADGFSISVSAIDLTDGEEIKIENISFFNEILSFDAFVESTQHRAQHKVMRSSSDGELDHFITLQERFVRINPEGK